jgi:3-hydroxyisobutyrate dehydrogenase
MGKHLIEAYRGPDGLLTAARPGSLFIDCSTVDIDSATAAHKAAGTAGMLSVDAPVSGGVGGATAGTLTFMMGGDDAAAKAAEPILAAMGKKIVHCGGTGAGQAAKICNNMILGISMIAVSEAFVLGEKLGLSHQALFDVASTSSGQCWSLTSYCPVPGPVPASPSNNAYKPGFAGALMLKDLRLSQEAAAGAGAQTALGRHAAEIYEAFVASGGGDADFSGVINFIRSAKAA